MPRPPFPFSLLSLFQSTQISLLYCPAVDASPCFSSLEHKPPMTAVRPREKKETKDQV
ncbi:hypothetical protein M406DRAFT_59485 [Cryphonectria parasitica EP155]|uniref:Uncharacterized protein n=1 Tax=Cryphonectria parasitica (strain ATCC 38755 / EP155) TaxID=660469 RepID=A0A9P5CTB9_CRYP1|nr:uncharacterized protein M406DRAFT_59485 [Cryphonectria parasitica EP155]KAF3770494.1 hypothetical protein M406DRAFT_59485 [Cryphonectria parasitica EP155]